MSDKMVVGVILESLHESYQEMVWPGIVDYAESHNIDLIAFIATSQDQVSSIDKHYDVIQNIVNQNIVDGLVIFTGAMAEYFDIEEINNFCDSFKPLPIVSVSLATEDNHSILVDNMTGVHEAVDHLVQEHNFRKLAFIKGPEGHEEADERFWAFKEGLKRNGIHFDPDLVAPGNFVEESGEDGVQTFHDRGVEYDAIVCADDITAIGAIKKLRKLGKSVPEDIAVVGFDDIAEAMFMRPSLSTVRQPLFEVGGEAIKTIDGLINGKELKKHIHLNTRFINRQSCSCLSEAIRNVKSMAVDEDQALQNAFEIYSVMDRTTEDIIALLADKNVDPNQIRKWVRELWHTFFLQLEQNSEQDDAFLIKLNSIIIRYADQGGDIKTWQKVLTILINNTSQLLESSEMIIRAEDLFQKSRIMIYETLFSDLAQDNMHKEMQQWKIREICQKLITTTQKKDILEYVVEEFPELGISACFIVLYENDEETVRSLHWDLPDFANVEVAYINGKQMVEIGKPDQFATEKMLPFKAFHENRPGQLVFMPLFFKHEHFGYMILEYVREQPMIVYEELRLHLCSALKSSTMMEELKRLSLRDELTGVYNRRGFNTLCNQHFYAAQRNKKSLTLYYADLDGLKIINDTYGHNEGDIAISSAANVLMKTFRKQDIIARVGGDEYIIMTVDSEKECEDTILARLKENIEDYNARVNKKYDLSISIGFVTYDSLDNILFEDIIREADEKMMEHKKTKKNRRK